MLPSAKTLWYRKEIQQRGSWNTWHPCEVYVNRCLIWLILLLHQRWFRALNNSLTSSQIKSLRQGMYWIRPSKGFPLNPERTHWWKALNPEIRVINSFSSSAYPEQCIDVQETIYSKQLALRIQQYEINPFMYVDPYVWITYVNPISILVPHHWLATLINLKLSKKININEINC